MRVDPLIVGRGALSAMVICAPAAIVGALVGGGSIGLLMTLLIFFGFAAGGWAACRLGATTPLIHGAAAAALSFVVIQGLGTLRRLFADESVNWIGFALGLLLASTIGVLGAMFADRLQRRSPGFEERG